MIKNKYSLLFFLLFLLMLKQVDRNMLIGFAPMIMEDLHLSNTQFGLLSGTFFSVSYAFFGILMGVLADRFDRTKIIAAGIFIWSVFTASTGFAKNFLQISLMRGFVGAGEASLLPSAASMLGDKFPPEKRATALGILFAGVPLGLGCAYLVAGALGPSLGWRNTFITLGFLGVVFAGLVLLFKDPERNSTKQTEGDYQAPKAKEIFGLLRQSLQDNPVLRYGVIGAVLAQVFYASQAFSQIWFVQERGFKWEDIVALYGLISMLSGAAGAVLGGILSDWYTNRFNGSRAGFICWLIVLLAPFVMSYRFIEPASPLFYFSIGAGFFLITAFYGPAFSLIQSETPDNLKATIVGILMLLINVLSLGLGSFLVGVAIDILTTMGVNESITLASLGTDVLAMLSGLAFLKIVLLQKTRAKAAA